MIDLGHARPVNALRLLWGAPYATEFRVQYWLGEDAMDPSGYAPADWKTFPKGTVSRATSRSSSQPRANRAR